MNKIKKLLEYLRRCVDESTSSTVTVPKPIIRDLMQIIEERDELQQLFDLQWKADRRAVKLWQAAHPGNDLVWPDHTNMVVWLMEQYDAHAQRTLRDALQKIADTDQYPDHEDTAAELREIARGALTAFTSTERTDTKK